MQARGRSKSVAVSRPWQRKARATGLRSPKRASQQFDDAMKAGQIAGRKAWLRTLEQARQGRAGEPTEDDFHNAIFAR